MDAMSPNVQKEVLAVRSLAEFFRTSVQEAINSQGVEVSTHTSHYVVNLLTLFSRSEDLFEDDGECYGIKPFALMLADAVDAATPENRAHLLQRMGDVALFMAGFFVESFSRRGLGIDYCINMGGNAYGSLCQEIRGTSRAAALVDVYGELSGNFRSLVDVLHEVRDGVDGKRDSDLLQHLELWQRTGSKRAAKILRNAGVVPLANSRRSH